MNGFSVNDGYLIGLLAHGGLASRSPDEILSMQEGIKRLKKKIPKATLIELSYEEILTAAKVRVRNH